MKVNLILAAVVVVAVLAAALIYFGGREPERAAPTVALPTDGTLDLLVFGIDGMEPSIARPLMEEGRMPNLAALMENGAYGEFENFGKLADSRIVWTSLVTGMKPENQGIGSKREHRGKMADVAPLSTNRTVDTIWTLLSSGGHSVAVLGWPGSWPAEELDGVVAGPYTQYVLERRHDGDLNEGISPAESWARLDPLYRNADDVKRADLAEFVDLDSRLGLESLIGQNYITLATSVAGDASMRDIARSVVDDPGVSNLMVYNDGVNKVSQRFWHYMFPESMLGADMGDDARKTLEEQSEALGEVLERYYVWTDGLLGEYMSMVREGGTVVLLSDHGYEGVKVDRSGMPRIGFDMHSRIGFFVMAGPRVRPGATAADVDLIDLAPTIMQAAGLELPDGLDGSVRGELLNR